MSLNDDLRAQLAPWITTDLGTFVDALATMFAEVEQYAFDSDDGTQQGWTLMFDPVNCPGAVLPWLAQWIGERFPPGLTNGLKRQWIGDRPTANRGSLSSIVNAAQRSLTGARTVSITERSGGDPDTVAVLTYTSETPNPAQVAADIKSVFPASMILVLTTGAGQSWNGVKTGSWGASWTAAKSHYATWGALASDIVGVTYTRAIPPALP
jgi:hypothetical protein